MAAPGKPPTAGSLQFLFIINSSFSLVEGVFPSIFFPPKIRRRQNFGLP
jgi:hypothetical protein